MLGFQPGYRLDMRLGVLDIGSNSAQLQIVDVAAGAPPLPALAVKTPTLLGEEITADGSISRMGIDRVTGAVVRSMQVAVQQQVDQLYPFVTSAVRDATNRQEVIEAIEVAAGVRPQHLSGEEEARLTYLAAHRWYGWSAGRLLLIDIGGGSMEIVLGRDAEPNLAISVPLGAGRLTREFLPADPPDPRRHRVLDPETGGADGRRSGQAAGCLGLARASDPRRRGDRQHDAESAGRRQGRPVSVGVAGRHHPAAPRDDHFPLRAVTAGSGSEPRRRGTWRRRDTPSIMTTLVVPTS